MPFLTEPEPERGANLPVMPGISRIVANNPSPMTYFGTNTYLIETVDGLVVLDPGPDFTKTPQQTLTVLRGLDAVRALGRPLLLALSRKDFLGAILAKPPRARDAGSLAALALLGAPGGAIARVHDVAASVDVVRTVEHLMGRQELTGTYLLPDELRHDRGAGSIPR